MIVIGQAPLARRAWYRSGALPERAMTEETDARATDADGDCLPSPPVFA
jgi:hypothetical protein